MVVVGELVFLNCKKLVRINSRIQAQIVLYRKHYLLVQLLILSFRRFVVVSDFWPIMISKIAVDLPP